MKNAFGLQLQAFLQRTGVKNAALAKVLQYDVSYISKWMSGKAVPSEKNVSPLCRGIAVYLSGLKDAAELLGESGKDVPQLAEWINESLLQAYEQDRAAEPETQTVTLPLISEDMLLTAADYPEVLRQPQYELYTAIDFFALTSESRLKLSGIVDGRFSLNGNNADAHHRMAISLPEVDKQSDVVYDSISLIHMLTGLSHTDFMLYKDAAASRRLMLVQKERFYASALQLGRKGQWGAFCKEQNAPGSLSLYQAMEARLGNETLMFRRSDMNALLMEHDYLQSVISTHVCWLLGHLTEQIFPADVFEELLQGIEEPIRTEMKRVYALSSAVLEAGQVKLMIYDSSFADLAISNEVDFFNRPVVLTVQQRVRVLEHLRMLADKTGAVRIIKGGFSSDFKYITNPCVFMSDALCYLRLENGIYENNLLVLNDLTIKQMFDRFFACIWDQRKDVVEDERSRVIELIEHYLHRVKMLAE